MLTFDLHRHTRVWQMPLHTHVHAHRNMCIVVCMHTHTCTCVHTHIHTQKFSRKYCGQIVEFLSACLGICLSVLQEAGNLCCSYILIFL